MRRSRSKSGWPLRRAFNATTACLNSTVCGRGSAGMKKPGGDSEDRARVVINWGMDVDSRTSIVSVAGLWLGRFKQAEETAKRLLAEWPASTYQLSSVHLYYGGICSCRGDSTRRRESGDASSNTPNEAQHLHRGVGRPQPPLRIEGGHEEALRHLEEAYEAFKDRGPFSPPCAPSLVYALDGKRDRVLEALRRSADVYPDFAPGRPESADAAAAYAWTLWSVQFEGDGELVAGLLAYARATTSRGRFPGTIYQAS